MRQMIHWLRLWPISPAEIGGLTNRQIDDFEDVPWTEDDLTSEEHARRATYSEADAQELRELARLLTEQDEQKHDGPVDPDPDRRFLATLMMVAEFDDERLGLVGQAVRKKR